MDGVLVIDKPSGPTSHDVVSAVRKALRERKVGHTGTLDPVATGVLPLVLGRATKIARYLTGGNKSYRATLRLGVRTTTLDAQGEVVEERPVNVAEADVRAALPGLTGDIEQVPPMYSAKKVQGSKLYELARQGIEVDREPKRVTVHRLELVAFEPPRVILDVECSAGTYVRVLADDLGQRLGCGAHLEALQRTQAGPFKLGDAVPLEDVLEDPESAKLRVVSIDHALRALPRVDVPRVLGRQVCSGYQLTVGDLRGLDTPTFSEDDSLVIGLDDGDPLAVVRALVASADLSRLRRDRQAFKSERVLVSRL